MSNYIEKAASPQILNYAWQFLPHDRGNWVCGLSVEEIRPNLIRHVGELSEQLLRGNYRPEPYNNGQTRRSAPTAPGFVGANLCVRPNLRFCRFWSRWRRLKLILGG